MVTFNHGVVILLRIPEDVTLYMEVVKKDDISWSTFYMGTSIIFTILGWYLGSIPLLFAALVYLGISIVHHRKMKKLF
ncbi:hypothetical protein [Thermococcus piezophilus]|uniref:hypothetical protein n=1 Tax=Thermococcus piezophilus TaxID=1712654 RepID=UPI001F2D39BE|nr:hypothetical protein [Thermococcus piezophilus]